MLNTSIGVEGGSNAVRKKFWGWNETQSQRDVGVNRNGVQTGTRENHEDWDAEMNIKDKRGGGGSGGASISIRRGPGRPRKQ